MTIVDKEVIGEGNLDDYPIPNVSLGIFIENAIKKNIDNKGDGQWLVRNCQLVIHVAIRTVRVIAYISK